MKFGRLTFGYMIYLRLPVLLVDFFMLSLLSHKNKRMALFCSWECCEDKYFKGSAYRNEVVQVPKT